MREGKEEESWGTSTNKYERRAVWAARVGWQAGRLAGCHGPGPSGEAGKQFPIQTVTGSLKDHCD